MCLYYESSLLQSAELDPVDMVQVSNFHVSMLKIIYLGPYRKNHMMVAYSAIVESQTGKHGTSTQKT